MSDKPYYQNDKKWQNNKIGFSSSLTIGQVGCMLTCFAMTVNHFGGNETPLSLNNKMVNAKGFNDAWIKGAQVPGLFPNLGFQRQKSVECKNKPAPMSDIDAALAAGSLVMVQVDREADATFQDEDGHWVLLQEKQGDDYTMIDPWYSERDSKKTLVGRYGFGRKQPEDIIQYAIWHGKGELPTSAPKTTKPTTSKTTKSSKSSKTSKPAPKSTGATLAVKPTVAQLTLRKQPMINQSNIIKTLSSNDILTVLTENAEGKIGRQNQWLHIKDESGVEGYVAAWYVEKTAVSSPATATPKTTSSKLTVKTTAESVSLRSAPRVANDTLITYLPKNTKLTVTEANGEAKIGVNRQWLQVETNDGKEGYVAAWFVVKA